MIHKATRFLKQTWQIISPGELFTPRFSGSASYWEQRYRRNGTSGLGSYGPLARMKADFINDYIQRHAIRSVVDLGVGDGNQLSMLDLPNYVGVDVSETALVRLRERFVGDSSKRFVQCNGVPIHGDASLHAELGLSLDVIYHLVEDGVFDLYLENLFHCATSHVIVYSSDVERTSRVSSHVRDRRFTASVESRFPQWRLVEVHRNPLGWLSRSDFFVYRKAGSNGSA